MSILDIQRSFTKPGCQIAMAISGAAIALTFVFTGAPMCAQQAGSQAGAAALVVAGKPVTYEQIQEIERSQGAIEDPVLQVQVLGRGIDQLIQQAVVVRLADDAGIKVDAAQARAFQEKQIDELIQTQRQTLTSLGMVKEGATDADFDKVFKEQMGQDPAEYKTSSMKMLDDALADETRRTAVLDSFKAQALLERIAGTMTANESDLKAKMRTVQVERMAFTDFEKPEAERLEAAKKAKERIEKGESFAKVHEELLGAAPAAAQTFSGEQLLQNPELAILADEKKGAVSEPFVENGVPVVYLLADKQENLPADFETNKERYLQQERQSLATAELQKRVDAAAKSSAVEWQNKSLKLVYDVFKVLDSQEMKLDELRAVVSEADSLTGPDNQDPRYTALAKFAAFDALANRATGDEQKELEEQRPAVIEEVLSFFESVDLRIRLAELQFNAEDSMAGETLLTAAVNNAGFDPQNEAYRGRIEGLLKSKASQIEPEIKTQIEAELKRWADEKAENEREMKEIEAERAAAAKELEEELAKQNAEEAKKDAEDKAPADETP